MRIYILLMVFILLPYPAVFCQSVRIEPNIATAETEYRDAQDAWIKSDPNLEADLYKRSPAEMRKRIRQAAALRDGLMQKKEVYLSLMVKRLDEMNSRFQAWQTSSLPADAIKKDLEAEQMRLLDEQDRLELRIKALPDGDEYTLVRRAMDTELTDLIGLQNNVARRIRIVGNIGKTQDSAANVAQANELAEKIADLRKLWEKERQEAVHSRSSWSQLYSDMEKSLDTKGSKRRDKLAGPGAEVRPARIPGDLLISIFLEGV